MKRIGFLPIAFAVFLIGSQLFLILGSQYWKVNCQNALSLTEGRKVDVFTQRGGKGYFTHGGLFGPFEVVVFYANVTYNGWAIQNKLVAFETLDPHKEMYTVLTGITNTSGIATSSYRLPFSEDNPPEWFGNWTVIAAVDIADVVINDTLEFEYTLHDIAIENLRSSKNFVGEGYPSKIEVNVTNLGFFQETFNLSIFLNSTSLTTCVIGLSPLSSTTISFAWNTTRFARGNYTIMADATIVPKEMDTTNNSLTDGSILITIPGDINGDKFVNAKDTVTLGMALGCTQSDLNWNPNADVNDDDYINAKDAIIIGSHFNESWA